MHLVIAVHCHQPLGNFDHVVAEAVDRAYLPFLDVLDRHPGVRVNLHYSGCLLEWLDRHRPEVLDRLAGLGDRIEWLGGGMYEPILPMIPPGDRVEQVVRHRRFVEQRFGRRPAVIWPAERVWDPAVCDVLAGAGMAGALVDDRVLAVAGLPEAMLDGYVTTDHFGSAADLFPISEQLRFSMPASPPGEVVAMLGAGRPDGLAVFGDDGEKFGLWPGSAGAAAAGGWLDTFLDSVEADGRIEITTVEAYRSRFPASAHLPVPAGSYREMSLWTAPPDLRAAIDGLLPESSAGRVSDPGVLSFAHRYPEVDVALRRMWSLSEASASAGSSPAVAAARTEVLRSQCNDSYWHGWFGGLYLPHLRAAVRERLIAADRMLEAGLPVEILDWNGDGTPEVAVRLPSQAWVLDPAAGGSLLFWDDLAGGWPVSDVVARHREPYHEGGPADRGPRRWLLDHLLPGDAEPAGFSAGTEGDLLRPIRWVIGSAHAAGDGVVVELLSRAGRKRVEAAGRALEVAYRLDGIPGGRFGPEMPVGAWDWRLRAGGSEAAPGVSADGSHFELLHEGRDGALRIELEPPGFVWSFPLETVSMSENGLERIVQGVVLWPHWRSSGAGEYRVRAEIAGSRE